MTWAKMMVPIFLYINLKTKPKFGLMCPKDILSHVTGADGANLSTVFAIVLTGTSSCLNMVPKWAEWSIQQLKATYFPMEAQKNQLMKV